MTITSVGFITKSDQTGWKEFISRGLYLPGAEGESDGVVLHGGEQDTGHDLSDITIATLTSLLGCLGVVKVVDNVILRIGPLNY